MPKHYERLLHPMVRDGGVLRRASWDEALDRAARGLSAAAGTSVGLFSCSKTTNELNYAAQKLMRTCLGSNNIDSCNRT
jgi:formate dehydrogenase major subunit